MPIEKLLPQGVTFSRTTPGLLGSPDFILCDGINPKLPLEMKTRHNLNLRNHDFWNIWRAMQRDPIMDSNHRRYDQRFKFQKRILAQIFGEMACNSLHYGVLSNYDDTWFLCRPENEPTTLYISRVVYSATRCPTL